MKAAENLAAFIRWVMRDVRYHRMYPCTVERQDGFGPLDLTPDDDEIRGEGLGEVTIRHGIPGLEVRVKPGARVLLGFMAGDPTRPYASLWESASIVEMRFAGGDKPIAREGDPVSVFWPPSVSFIATCALGAIAGTMTITSVASGLIDGGNPKVKA